MVRGQLVPAIWRPIPFHASRANPHPFDSAIAPSMQNAFSLSKAAIAAGHSRPWPQQGSESLTLSPPSASPPTEKRNKAAKENQALAFWAVSMSSTTSTIRCCLRRGSSETSRKTCPSLPPGAVARRGFGCPRSSSMVTPRICDIGSK